MTKGRRNPQPEMTPENMGDAIRRGDDFGHEIRVKTVMETQGIRVQHGWTYKDPITSKTRQFDLRAHFAHRTFRRHFRLALECKNLSPSSPLVITGLRRTEDESFHDLIAAERPTPSLMLRNEVRRAGPRDNAYPMGGFVGKSIVRLEYSKDGQKIVTVGDGDIYDRWSQALTSADELCKDSLDPADSRPGTVFTVVIPGVVVPDGALWILQYDQEGKFASGPVPSDSATFFLNHKAVVKPKNLWMNFSHLHFWTVGGLRFFIATLLDNKNGDWDEWFPAYTTAHTPRIPNE